MTTPMPTDLERDGSRQSHYHILEWENLTLAAPRGDKLILSSQSGTVRSGQLLAIMGPSGAGKSTFLDVLSKRISSTNKDASITFDGDASFDMRALGSYVEQDDALLGVLTVEETVTYAAKLSLPHDAPKHIIDILVQGTLSSLGLSDVAHNRIGTPIQRGISGGQKRRVTIACSVVARPRILLCDEPTSGLDSLTSYQVISSIKKLARDTNTIVVATIHQPNWETFSMFDKVLFLAGGRTMYQGTVDNLIPYFNRLGYPCPQHTNPADYVIGLINTDFSSSMEKEGRQASTLAAQIHLDRLADAYHQGGRSPTLSIIPSRQDLYISEAQLEPPSATQSSKSLVTDDALHTWAARKKHRPMDEIHRTWLLIQRTTLNYRRNILAYGIRLGMYVGMGFLLATIWINLGTSDKKINDRLSVHFFAVAFLGFMSVAGIPSFLEERAVFVRERNNGLYGPGAYVLANSLVTIPFLFLCATLFSVICYWAIGLHPGANAFFRFLTFLFLAIYIAEAQSVLVAAIIPIFVAALAIASFMNGFWMCVQGYFIRAVNLPRFWYYWAHWIDYQTFAFNLLVQNDLKGLIFQCTTLADESCQCSVPSSLVSSGQCALSGEDVLRDLDIAGTSVGLYAGIMIIIAVVYRLLFWGVLVLRKR